MEDIVPAIHSQNSEVQNLSNADFQKLLKTWFEENGLVDDLRAYVKYQMINRLRNTVFGKNIVKNRNKDKTLLKQAHDLIIAEYLLENNCHFTLSVFSNEVNISNILPDFAFMTTGDINTRLSRKNVVNILDLIGITSNSDPYKELLNLYFKANYKNSLFTCLINVISAKDELSHEEYIADVEGEIYKDAFYKKVADLLINKLSTKTTYKILKLFKDKIESERDTIAQEYIHMLSELKEQLFRKDQQIKEFYKTKQLLETKLLESVKDSYKLTQKLSRLKQKKVTKGDKLTTDLAKVESNNCSLKHCTDSCQCKLQHCTDKCQQRCEQLCKYKIDNDRLLNVIEDQKEEINKVNLRCTELMKEFNLCQIKITTLNAKLEQESCSLGLPTVEKMDLWNDSSQVIGDDFSPSVTDEDFRGAKIRLQQLEIESTEIDEKFKNYLIS